MLLLFSIPVVLAARNRGRKVLARNFLIAAVIIAPIAASIDVSSERLVRQCFDAGNLGCEDFGSAGFRALLIGGYILTALGETYLLWRE